MSEPKWEELRTWAKERVKDDYPEGTRCLSFTRLIDEMKDIEARLAPAPAQARKIRNFDFDLNGGMSCEIEETPAQAREDEALRLAREINHTWHDEVSNDYDHTAPIWAHELAKRFDDTLAALRSRQSPQVVVCPTCHGATVVMRNQADETTCSQCGGRGVIAAAPQPSPQGEDAESNLDWIEARLGIYRAWTSQYPAEIDRKRAELAKEIYERITRARLASERKDTLHWCGVAGAHTKRILDLEARLASEDREHTYAAQCAREKIQELESRLASAQSSAQGEELIKLCVEELRDHAKWAMRDIAIADSTLTLLQDHALRSHDKYAQAQLRNAFAYLDTARASLDFENTRAALERKEGE